MSFPPQRLIEIYVPFEGVTFVISFFYIIGRLDMSAQR